jgi:hypothetical protein
MRMKSILTSALVFALCGAPELIQAQTAPPATAPANQSVQPTAPAADNKTQPSRTSESSPSETPTSQGAAPQTGAQQKPSGVTVDPSQGPLEPAPAETPLPPDSAQPANRPGAAPADSSSKTMPQSDQPETQNLPANPEPQKPGEPVGAAAAEKGSTAGGAASKPAGTAIAPAKQGQVRSWLIRIGAIAAAGAALGTVYALSHKTPSNPPGFQTLGAH